MSVKHERHPSFPAALDALAAALGKKDFSPDEYNIVLAPDRYTLRIEQALFTGAGSLNTEVLTLSRLCRRVIGAGRILTREGGVMLAAKAIANVSDKLVYYSHATRYTDFAREAYETLMQTESSCAELSELSALGGAAREKLADLALIKSEYDALKNDLSDTTDRLKDLIAAAGESELVKNANIYAIGYKDATKLNYGVFDALARSARSFTYYDADPPTPRDALCLYSAPDCVSQYKHIAADILDYVRKGGRYGDISVVCAAPRTLSRILGEYGIRFYSDRATALFDTPPLAALYALYRLCRGADAALAIAFAKNPFSGCAREDAERLDLELTARGADFLSDDYLPENAGAKRALTCVKHAVSLFRSKNNFCGAVESVVDGLCFSDNPHRLFDGVTDLVSPITRLTELLKNYGGGGFDADAGMFFSASRAVSVSSLPAYTDTVSVLESASGLRMTRCKRLYVADFNEGVLPTAVADTGLLSDAELVGLGGAVEPTVREKNRRDREELFAALKNAETALCSYVDGGGMRESAFIYECADRIEKYSCAEETALLKLTDDARLIARNACTYGAAREAVARGASKHGASIAAVAGKSRFVSPPNESKVPSNRRAISVSELKHYFDCPYKRFLSDSVGLKERKRGGASAADFGIIMHEFMRRWAATAPLDAGLDAVSKIVNDVLDEADMFVGENGKAERRRMIADAVDFAEVNKALIEAGGYAPDPDRLEMPFGGAFTLGRSELPFVGVIDRVDISGDDCRVIDYKTGNTAFDLNGCREGLDMQLPLYAAALRESGKNVTGAFYVTLKPAYATDPMCVSGFMVKDTAVALDYDVALKNGERSKVFPLRLRVKDGVPTGFWGGGDKLMERGAFDDFVSGCVATAGLAADEISSGFAEISPAANACTRCRFGALCRDKKRRGAPDEEDESCRD